jgi:hypothetical protein
MKYLWIIPRLLFMPIPMIAMAIWGMIMAVVWTFEILFED